MKPFGKSFFSNNVLPAMTLLTIIIVITAANSYGAVRTFAERFATNARGDVRVIGNTVMTCPPSAACTNVQNGITAADNTAYNMVYVKDDPGSTYGSSSATLSIPAGSTVLWAGLYWGGESTAPPATVRLKTPASGGYATITATQQNRGTPPNQADAYISFSDITGYIAAGRSGSYTVADVVSTRSGKGGYGGWGIIVVFGDSSLPLRNLVVYDGFDYIGNNSSIAVTFSGFTTPLNGPVATNVGFIAGNGGLGQADAFSLAPGGGAAVPLQDALRQAANFVNSRTTDLGSYAATSPAYRNMLGWDVGRVNASGILGNGVTSGTITFNGPDKYFPYAFSFSTDIYEPVIGPNIVKTGIDVNGGFLTPGDIIRYTISLSNSGYDTGSNVVLTDPIPAYTTFSPGSLKILSGANSIPQTKTDQSGDDQADFCPGPPGCATPQVTFRLGSGATATSGGSLPYLSATSLSFDVTLHQSIPSGTIISNSASVSYSGQTLGATSAATSSAATSAVYTPPVATISFAPDPIDVNGSATMSITLTNSSTTVTTATDVAFTSIYQTGLINAATPYTSIICTPGSSATLTGGAAGNSPVGITNGTFLPNGSCTITISITSASQGNYTVSTGPITTGNAGSSAGSAAVLSVGNPAISTAFAPAQVLVNTPVTISFTISNPTATTLTNLAFVDPLTGMAVTAGSQSNSCGGTLTAATGTSLISLSGGTLAASSSCTITVQVSAPAAGYYANSTGPVTSNQANGLASNTAYLTAVAPVSPAISFYPPSVGINIPSTMTIKLTNPNPAITVSGVNFSTSPYPANLVNAVNAGPAISCTPGSSATLSGGAAGNNPIGMTGGSLLPNGVCTITVNISSNSASDYSVSTGPVSSINAGTATAATALLNVSNLAPPGAAISFAPASLPQSQTTTMTVTLSNANPSNTITGATTFSMSYPPGLINAAIPDGFTNCSGGTVTAPANGNSLTLSAGTIPSNGSCSVTVKLAATTGDTYYVNTGFIFTINAGTGPGAGGSVRFVAPPLITKSFTTNPIAPSTPLNLQLVLTNPGVNSTPLSGISVSDDLLPSGTVVNGTPAANQCGGTVTKAADNNSFSLVNGSLAANASCIITVPVISPSMPGSYTNTTGAVFSTEGGTGQTATAILSVGQPGITMAFNPTSILSGNTTTPAVMTFTLSNPTGVAMTGATFTNTYAAGITNAPTPNAATTCSGGTVTAAGSSGSISLAGGTIPAYGSCTVTVTINGSATVTNTLPAGPASTNPGALTVDGGGYSPNAAAATISVLPPPLVSKTFSPAVMPLTSTSTLTISISNSSATLLDNISFTDSYPGGGALFNFAAAGITCTAGSTATLTGGTAGSASVGLSNGSLAANGSCTITATVKANTAGNYNNSTGTVSWRATPPGGSQATTASPGATATLNVLQPFTFSKEFVPATIGKNDASLLTITLANPNSVPVTGVAFSDTYPPQIANSATPGVFSSCGGSVTAAAGGSTLELSNGTIPANSSCQVTVYVTTAVAGTWNNTLSSVSSSNGGTVATPATAGLTATALLKPSVVKTFSPAATQAGLPTTLTITITNPNPFAILGAGFTDSYPPEIVNDSLPAAGTSCPGGTVVASAGGGQVALSGATIPANSSCSVAVEVKSSSLGTWSNPASPLIVTSSNAADSDPAAAALLTIFALPNLTVTKSAFGATSGINAKPGQDVPYMVILTNTGEGTTSEVIVEDRLSPYISWKVNSLQLNQGTPASGLTLTFPPAVLYYSYSNGPWVTTAPVSGGGGAPAGYDGTVTGFKIDLSACGTMNGNNAAFVINYLTRIK